MKVSLSPDIFLCGWLGLKHQLINWLTYPPKKSVAYVSQLWMLLGRLFHIPDAYHLIALPSHPWFGRLFIWKDKVGLPDWSETLIDQQEWVRTSGGERMAAYLAACFTWNPIKKKKKKNGLHAPFILTDVYKTLLSKKCANFSDGVFFFSLSLSLSVGLPVSVSIFSFVSIFFFFWGGVVFASKIMRLIGWKQSGGWYCVT